MFDSLESWIGLFAAVVTTAASVPQVWKCWKSRSSGDLSLRMLVVETIGLSSWAVYGVMKGDWIIIVSNVIGTALFATLVIFKLTFPASPDAEPAPAQ
jgi:MtN3 and saliva related transmembrane protein